jgi:hypothetical protein
MIAMLTFVLFVPDILALAGATNAADPAINALLLLCMATFLAELGATSRAGRGTRCSRWAAAACGPAASCSLEAQGLPAPERRAEA